MAGMSGLEMVAVVTALVMVAFQIRQSAWLYPFGIVSSVLYAVVFYRWGLLATAMLQGLFVVLLGYGWVYWLRKGLEGDLPAVKRLSAGGWGVSVLGAGALAVVWGAVLAWKSEATLVWVDAPLAAASVLGQWLLARKYVETWLVWIVANAGYTVFLGYQGLWMTSGLYLVFFGLAVWGYVAWLRTAGR